MVSTTCRQLFAAAAEELEVIDSGGSLSTAEEASCLDRLQRLIDSMGVRRNFIYTASIQQFTLTSSKQQYTIGIDPAGIATADYSTTRPTRIDIANLFITSSVRKPLHLYSDREWGKIRYQTVSGPPQGVYFDGSFASGLATLYFYPIPDQGYSWEMFSWQQGAIPTAATDKINYPPGYADWFLYSMVKRIAPMFGRRPSDLHIEALARAEESLTAMNSATPDLMTDELGGDGRLYNWRSGLVE
jgi:hypothetical protein